MKLYEVYTDLCKSKYCKELFRDELEKLNIY
jgi:hypothetical protein